jgi:hypothetical protein
VSWASMSAERGSTSGVSTTTSASGETWCAPKTCSYGAWSETSACTSSSHSRRSDIAGAPSPGAAGGPTGRTPAATPGRRAAGSARRSRPEARTGGVQHRGAALHPARTRRPHRARRAAAAPRRRGRTACARRAGPGCAGRPASRCGAAGRPARTGAPRPSSPPSPGPPDRWLPTRPAAAGIASTAANGSVSG